MKRGKKPSAAEYVKEHRTDAVFAGIALLFLGIMVALLIYYNGLRNQNQAKPEEYGNAMQALSDIKIEKNELESKVEAARRELEELNKKIAALSGK